MPQPPAYNRSKDFTENFGSETDHSALNAELDAVSNSINDARANLGLIQADDGKLRAQAITQDTLSSTLVNYLIDQATQGAVTYSGIAQTEAGNAATSATNAAASASSASNSATNASASATAAASSASSASTSATNAAASESAAASSASSASTSANTATTAATSASNSASSASTSATNASNSATTATTKAGEAATSAGNAATSATNAANSASAASTSATNAANSANAAAASAQTLANATPYWRNRLINANFPINQRAVSGTVTLAAGAYGHDRWKAGASGCTYTFAASGNDVVITITAGSLMQVIEAINIEGGVYALSHAGTAQARIAINGASTSGSYTAATTAAPLVSGSATANQQVTVEFSAGTVSRVQLEPGTVATPFERRPYGMELSLCHRYCAPLRFSFNARQQSTTQSYATLDFPVVMRAAPTLVLSPVTGTIFSGASATAITNVVINGSAPNHMGLSLTHNSVGAAGYAADANLDGTPLAVAEI